VDAWTSSLGDSRANLSATLESVKQLKIPGISSHISETESESADPELFSSKMLKESSPQKQETENQFSNMSSESWKDWVTSQRQEYSQRVKSQHLTSESGSLSLAWPTPRAGNPGSRPNGKGGKILAEEAKKNWATPNTMDVLPARSPEKLAEAKKKGGCKNLREEVMNWPTASVAGCVEGGVAKNVEMTPSGFKATRENGTSYGAKLRDAVIYHEENWPTITVNEEKYRIKGDSQASKCLTAMAVRGELGHPDQANLNTNGKSRESQGKLNPDWVEQLMGLPVGWTDLGFWATESSQLPQPKPSSPSSKG
jgi:hypothetical protein